MARATATIRFQLLSAFFSAENAFLPAQHS